MDGAQISKNETSVEAAMKKFTSVITVINYPQNHWITLQFHTKKEILEVFDSMVPFDMKHRSEQIRKVRSNNS